MNIVYLTAIYEFPSLLEDTTPNRKDQDASNKTNETRIT